MSRESNIEKIRQGFKKATDFEITITIKGSLLVNNGLVEAWRELRGIDEGVLIDEDFTDSISIYQAKSLGIIEKL